MPIRTKRWDDPVEPDDGFRLLICRYRPRGLKKEFETWDAWEPQLAPSSDLHAAAYGKQGRKVDWPTYRRLYLREMARQTARIQAIAQRVRAGETITLLCSSHCTREDRCHRSLLRELIEQQLAANPPQPV